MIFINQLILDRIILNNINKYKSVELSDLDRIFI